MHHQEKKKDSCQINVTTKSQICHHFGGTSPIWQIVLFEPILQMGVWRE